MKILIKVIMRSGTAYESSIWLCSRKKILHKRKPEFLIHQLCYRQQKYLEIFYDALKNNKILLYNSYLLTEGFF